MRALYITFILCIFAYSAGAGENRFLSSSLSRARSLAMGSAYHSLIDDFSAGIYNPGAFRINNARGKRKYRLFFNPAGMAVAFYDYSKYNRDFIEDNELTFTEGLQSAALLFKGAVFTTRRVDFGINLGEEIINNSSDSPLKLTKRFYSIEGNTYGSFNSAFVNIKIASTVSVGVAGTMYKSRTEGQTSYKGGYTFGVLLNPNPKLNVGIAYNDIPEEFSKARFVLESIEGGTVTSGISYYPDEKTVVSIDLRNLNKEDKLASREIHTGFERIFRGRIALRAGYYRKKLSENDVYSIGIGILPTWEKISKFANSTRSDIISYTLITEENGYNCRWHVFSLLLRF